ncbi:MAG: hypothetical protein WDM86_02900 [Rhizomicrobium sp.]
MAGADGLRLKTKEINVMSDLSPNQNHHEVAAARMLASGTPTVADPKDAIEAEFHALCTERFLTKLESEFDPLTYYLDGVLETKHGVKFKTDFHFGDFECRPDGVCWAYGLFTTTAPDGQSSSILATGDGRAEPYLLGFEGDAVLFEGIYLNEHLAEVAAALVGEVERQLNLPS